jgi:hypothetical protein
MKIGRINSNEKLSKSKTVSFEDENPVINITIDEANMSSRNLEQ